MRTYITLIILLAFFGKNSATNAVVKEKHGFDYFSLDLGRGFTENKGQILAYDQTLQNDVKFEFRRGGTTIYLLENGIAYQFTKKSYPQGYFNILKEQNVIGNREKLKQVSEQIKTETYRMDMVLQGANPNAEILTEGKSEDYINYYNRNALDVHHYNSITYRNIYPGIDWVIYSKDGEVKYDFVLKPGADASLIKMQFNHQESLNLNEDGSFTLKNLLGSITEESPVSFQGEKKINTSFKLQNNTISFVLDNYNKTQALTIDPLLQWATYYGDAGNNYGSSCATDAAGNIYLIGATEASSFISFGGYQITYGGGITDAYVVKFNSMGLRIWATFYGGTEEEDNCFGAVDAAGNIYLSGTTASTTNIASGGFQNTIGGVAGIVSYDAFLVKFNANGLRLWATYYGGVGDDQGFCCSVDQNGNVFLSGQTLSSAAIASGGFQNTYGQNGDAFLVKFNSNGQRQWATYFGGNDSEAATTCKADASGNLFLGGVTSSTSNIASGGHQGTYGGGNADAFLVKFDANGSRLWSTYYGDAGLDRANACTADASGNVYLCGITSSTLNIASGGHQNTFGGNVYDAFIVKFNTSGQRQWATYYGGSHLDFALSCSTDASGNIYMSGTTESTAGIASGAYQTLYGGGLGDAFLVKFNTAGLRLMGTYYGDGGEDAGVFCAVDVLGNVLLGGDTDSGQNISSGGFQNTLGGLRDAFVVKFCELPAQLSAIAGKTLICLGASTSYSVNPVAGAMYYKWTTPNSNTLQSASNILWPAVASSGVYSLAAVTECGVGAAQTISITVDPCTGLTETFGEEVLVKVYPNPAKEVFSVEASNLTGKNYSVHNLLGEAILKGSFTTNTEHINLQACPNGVYLLLLEHQNSANTVIKLIKE